MNNSKYPVSTEKSLYYMLMLLAFSYPLLTILPRVGGNSIWTYFYIISTILYIVCVMFNGKLRLFKFQLVVTILVFWGIFSYLWSIDPNGTFGNVTDWIFVLVSLFIFTYFIKNPKYGYDIFLSYILGTYILIVDLFINYSLNVSYSSMRFTAFQMNPNVVGMMISLGLPAAFYVISTSLEQCGTNISPAKKMVPILSLLYIFLGILAIFLTGSRQSIVVVLVISVIYSVYLSYNYEHVLKYILIIGIFITTVFVIFLPIDSVIQRTLSISNQVHSLNFGSRITQWKAGYQLFLQSPVLGIGSGAFISNIEPYIGYAVATDNTYLYVLYELGIIGLIIFVKFIQTLSNLLLYDIHSALFLFSVLLLFTMNDLLLSLSIWILLSGFVSIILSKMYD